MDVGLRDKVAIVTGAGGVICGEIADILASEGAAVALWDIDFDAAERRAAHIRGTTGRAVAFRCDVTDRESVEEAMEAVPAEFGTIDILVNGAGGTSPDSTTSETLGFFDLEPEALQAAMSLNWLGAVLPSQAVGRVFAAKGSGAILNVSSVAGDRPLTRVIAYSNAKAALNSFTRWLAVYMATEYSPRIRVNAIAPGFVMTAQNKFLLVDEQTGEATDRGRKIVEAVPMARYGEPREIAEVAVWLVSDRASFITGAVIPIDGGLSAYAGV